MKHNSYQREIYLGEYRIEWADQKISLDCSCGTLELEVFSDTFTICPACKRRYSILELIKVETYFEDTDDDDLGDTLDFMEKNNW
jgi:hypothetical protein